MLVFDDDGKVDFVTSNRRLRDHALCQPDLTLLRTDGPPLLDKDGIEFLSMADAETLKENYAARLKQIEYSRESARYVTVDDVAHIVTIEYDCVREAIGSMFSRLASKLVK